MSGTYTPDVWVVVEITGADGISCRRILAGDYGGYTGGDSWKLSSGIVETTDYPEHIEFLNHSGSVYVCYKNLERFSGMTYSIYQSYEKMALESDGSMSFTVINYGGLQP